MKALDALALPLTGTHLIEASAGTGKTYTIATLFMRLVVERRLDIDRILVVTFTEAAAAELRDRVRDRLRSALQALEAADAPDAAFDPALRPWVAARAGSRAQDRERLERALQGFDEATISTIHGFCHRVLQDSAFETGAGLQTELLVDELPLLEEVVRDYWAKELYGADPLFVSYLQDQRVTPRTLLPLARLATMHRDVTVLPEKVVAPGSVEREAWRDAKARFVERWRSDRRAVVELLSQHPGLHQGHYKPEQLARLFEQMDGFADPDTADAVLGLTVLKAFCASTLRERTKKKYEDRPPAHPFFDLCDEMLQLAKPLARYGDAKLLAFRRKLVDEVRRELPKRKRKAGMVGFDDLLHDVRQAVTKKSGRPLVESLRRRHQAALIDEFQDTDPVQYKIFQTIYEGTNLPLYLIGDPKQAIYGFRGADVFAYLGAARDVPVGHRHTMQTNWRSDPGVLRGVEALFTSANPFLLEDIRFVPVGSRPGARDALFVGDRPLPPFEVRFARRDRFDEAYLHHGVLTAAWAEQHVPAEVAEQIAELLAAGAHIQQGERRRTVEAGDIAVLVRSNAQAAQIQAALRERGITAVIYGDASVLETRECKELERVLAAVAEPTSNHRLKAAITTEMIGVTATALATMEEDEEAWADWVERFRGLQAQWADQGFIQMFRAWLRDAGIPQRLLRLRDGERRMTNLLHLAELLHTAATREHLGPAGLLRWLQQAHEDERIQAEAMKLRLESDARAVQVVTVHRSKGLEYPIVYCPYLWAAENLRDDEVDTLLFHDDGSHRLTLDLTPHKPREDPKRKRAAFELQAESLRLLYVALTRAKHRCVVLWGAVHGFHHSALGYCLHAPRGEAWRTDPDAVAATIKPLADAELLAQLRKVAPPSWAVLGFGERTLDPGPAAARTPPRLEVRPAPRLEGWDRTSSFTELRAASRRRRPSPFHDALDHDEGVEHVGPAEQVPVPVVGDPVMLADFPRGARVGNLFHDILEHLDFTAPPEARRPLVRHHLTLYGFDDAVWGDRVDAAVERILRAPLLPEAAAPRLGDLPREAGLRELAFVVPVAPRDADLALTRRALAQVFREHPEGLPPRYGDHVERLGFEPLRGSLRGFIDLVARHEGRWYVVDYKTNHLGGHLDDYAPAALDEVMATEHYLLQAHLYALAVVRHLRRRVRGFDPTRDFGGVLYLFLRGMTEAAPPGHGVWLHRPPAARLDRLDAVLTGSPEVPA